MSEWEKSSMWPVEWTPNPAHGEGHRWRCMYCKLEEGVPGWMPAWIGEEVCPRCGSDPLVALVVKEEAV